MTYISINYQGSIKLDANQVFSSPTFSYQSRDKWASKIVNALDEIHSIAPPTHWATVKVNEYLQSQDIRMFLNRLSKAIEYQNKKTQGSIAVFGIPEINDIGHVHFHLLIRATVDPMVFISAVIAKHNAKNKRKFSIDYLEKPTSVEAITKYTTKLGRHNINLFSSGSLTRYSYSAGKYFLGVKRKELVRQCLDKFFESKETQTVNPVEEGEQDIKHYCEKNYVPLMDIDGKSKTPSLVDLQNKQYKNYSDKTLFNKTSRRLYTQCDRSLFNSSRRYFLIMLRFSEYCQFREGLWLSGKNALPGYSRASPLPKKPTPKLFPEFKPPKPPAIKAVVPPATLAGPRVDKL